MIYERIDLALVTQNAELIARVEVITKEFAYSYKYYQTVDEFLESKHEHAVLIGFIKDDKNPNLAAELAQAAKQLDSSSFVICGIAKNVTKEVVSFAKRSGAEVVLLEDELFTTSKLEFAVNQTLRASYLPVKASEFNAGVPIPFDVYHLMPQRKKFIQFIFQGDILDEARITKMMEVGEVYFHRSQARAYKKYVEDLKDSSAAGLARRCRAQFMALYSEYSYLALVLTDQTERASFGEGEKLLVTCRELCQDLVATLGKFDKVWDVINNSAIGEFGSVERAPAVASYAALFCIQTGFEKIDDIMLVALLVDLGIIFLDPAITRKIRENNLDQMSPEETDLYHRYPHLSMNIVLDRKIGLSEKMRNALMAVHERANGKGFPKGILGHKLPLESQMIQFCKDFDQRTVLRMGKARVDQKEIRDQLVEEDFGKETRFTQAFLESLKRGFGAGPAQPLE